MQTVFLKDVLSMVNVREDIGNPFEEESQDQLVPKTKEIAPPGIVDTLRQRTSGGENKTHRRGVNLRSAYFET